MSARSPESSFKFYGLRDRCVVCHVFFLAQWVDTPLKQPFSLEDLTRLHVSFSLSLISFSKLLRFIRKYLRVIWLSNASISFSIVSTNFDHMSPLMSPHLHICWERNKRTNNLVHWDKMEPILPLHAEKMHNKCIRFMNERLCSEALDTWNGVWGLREGYYGVWATKHLT